MMHTRYIRVTFNTGVTTRLGAEAILTNNVRKTLETMGYDVVAVDVLTPREALARFDR